MNKTASNAVYVVVAVVLIFAASAHAAPLQSASTLLACTAAQLSLTLDGEGGNFDGMSESGALLVVRNISSRTCPGRPAQASLRITSGTDILLAPFTGHLRIASGQDAKHRFAYLKRDPVYVRSKI